MLDEVLPHGFLQRRDVQAEDVRHVVPLVHMLRNEGTHKAVVTARVRGVLCDEEQTEDACPCVKGGGGGWGEEETRTPSEVWRSVHEISPNPGQPQGHLTRALAAAPGPASGSGFQRTRPGWKSKAGPPEI